MDLTPRTRTEWEGLALSALARGVPTEAEVSVASEQEVLVSVVEMAALAQLPPLPPQFKSIQHHLRTAQEHDKRDPVVAYYCESLRVAMSFLTHLYTRLLTPAEVPGASPPPWLQL